MKRIVQIVLVFGLAAIPATSFAYSLSGDGCNGNGNECKVYCDNGALAGSMYWNGSVWTDGVKSSSSKDEEARAICRANGSSCT
jgi:hypothetical protein